jgi:hypothetical protein
MLFVLTFEIESKTFPASPTTMDPSVLNSSYKAYKADTAIFLKWLFETGTRCGYTPSSQDPLKSGATAPESAKTPRLKGKVRKQAKQAATASSAPVNESRTKDHRLVALKYMVPLARAIVESVGCSISGFLVQAEHTCIHIHYSGAV